MLSVQAQTQKAVFLYWELQQECVLFQITHMGRFFFYVIEGWKTACIDACKKP